ncbi:MBG domain-containing protein [Congregicoccus parvus]|uniref:MBG domain-containing protein n=1 Tax=Congregicoccus parvus TaxID=3081749 RepID=UPI003FA55BB4
MGPTEGSRLQPRSAAYFAARALGTPPKGRSGAVDRDVIEAIAALREGDEVVLSVFDGEQVQGRVNLVQRDAEGWVRVGGALSGAQAGSFALATSGKTASGFILLPDEHVAYELATERDGQVLLGERPLDEVMCFPLPRDADEEAEAESVAGAAIDRGGSPGAEIEVPSLSSRPSAVAVVHLDFDGEVVSDPSWNGGETIVAAPAFLSAEQISEIWARVAEDFAPFDVDITTDPERYAEAPVGRRMRCIVTPTNFHTAKPGGVAFVGSFRRSHSSFSETIPCWVFNRSIVGIAEAASHEIGHTFGLRHDGLLSPWTEYYEGHGGGAVGWAPIMGNSYYQPVTHWSRGEYSGANNQQDDVALIASEENRVSFVGDEAGDTFASAAALHAPLGRIGRAGVIAHAGDVDLYVFNCVAGTIEVHALPAPFAPNLDIRLDLLDASGAVLATADPDRAMDARITSAVAAGTYYLRVDGVGRGAVQGDGYSDYSSIGAYTLEGRTPGTGLAPVITSLESAVAVEGRAFRYETTAENAPTSFEIEGFVPVGLRFDRDRGVLEGTPAAGSAGAYALVLRAVNAVGVGTRALELVVVRPLTLVEALDAPTLAWETGGEAPWIAQDGYAHDGEHAARSGTVGAGGASVLRTTVRGPATLRFHWSCDSEENFDQLVLAIDGVEIDRISGRREWAQASRSIGTGVHVVEWIYRKDESVSVGQDAGWVDRVVLDPIEPPAVTSRPAVALAVGRPVDLVFEATNSPWAWSVAGTLPPGLEFHAARHALSGTPTKAGVYPIEVAATNDAGTGRATVVLHVSAPLIPLGIAVDAPALQWTTGGAAGWFGQTEQTSDDVDAARSGAIGHDAQSWLETRVVGPAAVSFSWRVDGEESSDQLVLRVDGVVRAAISGSIDWESRSVELGTGEHVLRWTYQKDGTRSIGEDAGWLDAVVVHEAPERIIALSGALDFPTLVVGESAVRTLDVRNLGNAPLAVEGIAVPEGFRAAWSGTIEAGGSQPVTVRFSPARAGLHAGRLEILSDKTAGVSAVDLAATATVPVSDTRILQATGDLDFGDVAVGASLARTLVLHNAGNAPLSVSSVDGPEGFAGEWSGTIAPGRSVDVAVRFTPHRLGPHAGTLAIASDRTSGGETLAVLGRGVEDADPLTWADIGGPSFSGRQRRDAARAGWSIVAGGADMWGGSDQFRFGSLAVRGDGELVVRVDALVGVHPWARVGLSMRASTSLEAAHVVLVATKANGVDLQWRAVAGGPTRNVSGRSGEQGAPVWLRLVRRGAVFTGFSSADGTTWTEVGRAMLELPEVFQVGLVACAVSRTGWVEAEVSAFRGNFAGAEGSTRILELEGDLDFGDVLVGTRESRSLLLRNRGSESLNVSGLRVPTGFFAEFSGPVPSGGAVSLPVVFSPPVSGRFEGVLTVESDQTSGTTNVLSSGAGVDTPDPLEWSDVGEPLRSGRQARRTATDGYSIAAGGADMFGARDEFRFGSQRVVGTGETRVRVEALEGPHAWSRVGLALRTSSAPDAAHVSLIATRSNGIDLQWRSVPGGPTQNIGSMPGVAFAPVHLRLVREGGLVRGFRSVDGASWIEVASIALPAALQGEALAGLIACAVSSESESTSRVSGYTSTFAGPRAPASVVLGSLEHTFDGGPKAATVTTVPAGLDVIVTYDGASAAPIDAGTYTVTAVVDDPAYEGVASGTLEVARARQTIAFARPSDRVFGAGGVALQATSDAGLPVAFELVSGAALLEGPVLTPTGAGTVVVRAVQGGDANRLPAEPVQHAFVVARAPQTIAFTPLPNRTWGEGAVTLAAASSSGLPVSFAVVSGPASVVGSTVIPTGAGVVTVRATQPGGPDHLPAPAVERSFVVAEAAVAVSLAGLRQVYDGSPKAASVATNPPGIAVRLLYDGSETPPYAIGEYTVTAQVVAANFTGTASAVLAITAPNPAGSYRGTLRGAETVAAATGDAGGWAMHVAPGGAATLLATEPGGGATFAAEFVVRPDGSFTAVDEETGAVANGTVLHGIVSGSVVPLGWTFEGTAAVGVGVGAEHAGVHGGAVLHTARGSVAMVVAPDGSALVVVRGVGEALGGVGAVGADGSVRAVLADGSVWTARLAPGGGGWTGTLEPADGGELRFDVLGRRRGAVANNRIVNLSTRGEVHEGDDVMIVGFVVAGEGTRRVLVRAVGPGLSGFVDASLEAVSLRLSRQDTGVVVAENDGWSAGPDATVSAIEAATIEVGAPELARGSRDSVLLVDLWAGPYTAEARGVPGGGRIGIAEVYSVYGYGSGTTRLTNISTRARVATGEGILIPGFATEGDAPRRVLIRAVGPGLASLLGDAALVDPIVRVFTGDPAVLVAENDDWSSDSDGALVEETAALVGAFALEPGSKDAALVFTVPPHTGYTIHVSGADGATGIVLAEIYEIP